MVLELIDTSDPALPGLHLEGRFGEIHWYELVGDGMSFGPGVEVWLMDGETRICRYLESCGRDEAAEIMERQRQIISPWALSLREVDRLRTMRETLADVRDELSYLKDASLLPKEEVMDVTPTIRSQAREEDDRAKQRDEGIHGEGAHLRWLTAGDWLAHRMTEEVRQCQRTVLAVAPDVDRYGAPLTRWEWPRRPYERQGQPAGPALALELLAAWRMIEQDRDPLHRWAITNGLLSKTAASEESGVARSTIDRLLG
ncbi:hypothetical protein [Streptomyces sp. WMMC897]|uniref:hypothetical protein n=1 Tax=Streptomyces sp. WMMC897 TaxID=3014782 RepID=UPI0022B5F540|nr:hypothetical protein [Streptomyces sp. WMMC897]MCZ7413029.1 hypothetical protein [Streptomyces sp. WMMC897]MCZ7413089.1 hypothetical protein [Streptomyces sp. WMMC897]MCZ7415439.1 hypothetical protein [Streptomyces sp. WMMC897]